jgi:hypothetical protein
MARMGIITPFGSMEFGGDIMIFIEPKKTMGFTEVSDEYM